MLWLALLPGLLNALTAHGVFASDDAATHFEGALCKRLSAIKGTEELTALGFDPSVAQRIAIGRADVQSRVEKNSAEGAPIIVYRAIRVPPNEFKPVADQAASETGASYVRLGEIWAHTELMNTMKHARIPVLGLRYVTVIEYQVPSFMFTDASGNRVTHGKAAIRADLMPDSRPFIRRIGVIDLERNAGTDLYNQFQQVHIRWLDYDSVFTNGVFHWP